MANLKELMLKMSQKLKKVSEWKPLISKDTKKIKKWMNRVLEKENQEEQDLINSIMRSSSEGSRNDGIENIISNRNDSLESIQFIKEGKAARIV